MAQGRSRVLQERGRFAHVHDDNFFMAVVIQVTERQTARSVRIGDSGSRLRGEIIKLPIAAVPVEQSLLPERLTGASGVDLRVYMTIGEDQVLPSIVIGIDCRCAPAQITRINGETCFD